ncbi:MAG: LytTR family transcriptional regulator DNA-binding domain-containing protein [Saprospiraceae bacterium]|nr:LytTR family transcriptional regulator DNA-binding domain-containing protein [Saprospiraceae bacterium]MBP7307158.1 LytTR family transcriptional regulator DNA-binding domain-containing protein [Saprospiraceae bacterium]
MKFCYFCDMIFKNNILSSVQEKIMWVFFYLLIALSFIFIANDNTLVELLDIPSFFSDVLFAIVLTYGVGFYLSKLNTKLDLEYPWIEYFKIRLVKQFVFGVLLPLMVAILLEIAYLKSIDISFFESSILNLELPLAFIFLMLINLGLLADNLLRNKKVINEKHDQIFKNSPKTLNYINVQKGLVEENLPLERCALIMSSNKLLWLKTFEGEKYRLQGTLDEWEKKLKYSNFYRINRQYIVSYISIQSVEPTSTRKLKVNFVFPTENVYISKPNVAKFKQWWKQ